jgi:aldehyde dehydrogenase (NAD+)
VSTQTTIESAELFIGGDWIKPQGSERISVVAASTEEPVGSVPNGTNGDIDAAVKAARAAFDDPSGWSSWSSDDRAQALERLAAALAGRGEEIAHRVSLQNGMPISLALQVEAVFPAVLAQYYAGLIRQTALEEDRQGLLGGTIHVLRKPVGVVGAIVPWNYPQTLAMFKLAPLLAAGCTVVMKPSPETVLDSLLLADAIAEAGLPAGVVNIVPAGREVGAYLVEHPGIDKVAFTGSSASGRAIARRCGELLRQVTLELGGKSAAIVLDDADLAKASSSLGALCFGNSGQTCFAMSRVLVPEQRYDEAVEALTSQAAALVIGDPLAEDTTLGPLASSRRRSDVEGRVRAGVSDGARVVKGGRRPASPVRGYFYEPTVLAEVTPGMPIAQEEICGPVATVIRYRDESEAVAFANDGFGLAATVWTGDPQRGLNIAKRTRVGTFGVNLYEPDIGSPWGGRGASGQGSAYGPEGMDAYLTTKSVFLPAFG